MSGLDRRAKGVIASSGGSETIIPECIEAVAEQEGSEGEYAGGAWNRPEHVGLLEALSDNLAGPGFDHSAADESIAGTVEDRGLQPSFRAQAIRGQSPDEQLGIRGRNEGFLNVVGEND